VSKEVEEMGEYLREKRIFSCESGKSSITKSFKSSFLFCWRGRVENDSRVCSLMRVI
jgi:hypothetical protein